MDVPRQESRIDDQSALHLDTKPLLVARLREARRDTLPPVVTTTNPHSWENYVRLNAGELRDWITT